MKAITVNMNTKKIIFDKDITLEILENEFLKCKSCPSRIYQDIQSYFQKNIDFVKEYNKVINGEYTIDHLNRTVVENGNNPIAIMIKVILHVFDNFKENVDEYQNSLELLSEYENYLIQLYDENLPIEQQRSIQHVESIIDEIEIDIDELTPLYNPTESKWYYKSCPNKLPVYKRHEMIDMLPNEDYYVGFRNCCNLNMKKIVESMIITYLFEVLSHKKVLPIFKKYMNYPTRMEKNIKKKLVEFKNQNVLCCDWKGSNYYYKKFFYKSIYLDNIPISNEELCMKYVVGFDDMICGHPKASHGWMYESWLEYQEMMSN